MTKAVAKKEATELAIQDDAGIGAENITAQDIMLAKLLLQQPLSVKVVDGEAKPGDLVDSISGEKFGDHKSPCDVIPIKMFRTRTLYKIEGTNRKYISTEQVGPDAFQAPREFERDGDKYSVDLNYNFYVIPAGKAKEPGTFPMVLSFRRTSFTVGKQMNTLLLQLKLANQPAYGRVVTLGAKSTKNDKGSFFVFSVKSGRATDKQERDAAAMWSQQMDKGLHHIDDSDMKSEQAPSGAPSADF